MELNDTSNLSCPIHEHHLFPLSFLGRDCLKYFQVISEYYFRLTALKLSFALLSLTGSRQPPIGKKVGTMHMIHNQDYHGYHGSKFGLLIPLLIEKLMLLRADNVGEDRPRQQSTHLVHQS